MTPALRNHRGYGWAITFNAYRPNVDLHGVDLNRYETDMRNCEAASADAGFSFSNPIADCMVKRGYRINHNYQ
jgi:hypothetical protein